MTSDCSRTITDTNSSFLLSETKDLFNIPGLVKVKEEK